MTPEQLRRLWDALTKVLRLPPEPPRELKFPQPPPKLDEAKQDEEPPRAA